VTVERVRRTALALVLCASLAVWLGACRACEHDEGTPSEAGPRESPRAHASEPSLHNVAPPPLPCRAVTVDGDVRAGAARMSLTRLAEIPLEGWLSLAPNARIVAKDPRTARETTFRGPARARACVESLEESWLASGTFQSASGVGQVPGGEEWLVTPVGVVRFGASTLTVEVTSAGMRAAVGEGVAFVWVASDASLRGAEGGIPDEASPDEGWVRVSDGTVTSLAAAARRPLDAARASVDDCSRLGKKARDLAGVLLRSGADGTTASQQVLTRRLARGACAVAELRVELLAPSDERDAIAASLAACRWDWRVLPIGAHGAMAEPLLTPFAPPR
jgi:hypothetical protein